MKKLLLISLMLLAICLVGCEEKKTEEVVVDNGESQVENVEDKNTSKENELLNMSFEERTKEAKKIISLPNYLEDDYLSKECIVTNASLRKDDENFIMTLSLSTPVIFNKEEIDEAYNKAQENGTYEYKGYTFYKDNDVGMNFDDSEQSLYEQSSYNFYKIEYVLATTQDYPLIGFTDVSTDSSKYFVQTLNIGFSHFDKELLERSKEIEITLLPEDKVMLNASNEGAFDFLTVEELYNKAINGEKIKYGSYNEREIELSYLGDSQGPYLEYQNAVEINEFDEVVINYTFGGI